MSINCTVQDRVRNTATLRNAFKDFVEIYIKNPAMAAQKFPEINSFMKNEWSKAFPKDAKDVSEAASQYAEWYKNADDLDQVRSRIYFDRKESWAEWFNRKIEPLKPENLYRSFIDDLADIQKIAPGAYELARIYRGAAEGALSYVKDGRYEFSEGGRRNVKTGKSLDEIVEPIKDNREYASAYLAARTIAEDLARKDKKYQEIKSKSDKTKEDLNYLKSVENKDGTYTKKTESALYKQNAEAVKIAEKKFSNFRQFGKEFSDFMRDNLKFALDAELISKDSYDKMVNSREMYAPLYRVVEGSHKHGLGLSRGMEPKDATKLRTNVESMYDIVDPIQTGYNNAAYVVAMSERNAIMRKFAQEVGGKKGDVLFEEVTTPKQSKEELLKQIKDKGLPIEYFKDLPQEVVEVLMENPVAADSPTVNVFDKGVKKTYEVDPVIYEALKGVNSAREAGVLSKIFSIPAQGLRFGATITPAYITRAFVRDIPHALTTSQFGITAPDILQGVFSAFKKDEWYHEFVRSGGAYSSAQSLTRASWSKNLEQLSKAKDRGFIQKWVFDNKLGLKKMQDFSHALENAPRIAEFRKGIESGASRQKAALAARDITLDFQRKGAAMYVWNNIVPFSNAFIQGNAQFLKFMKPKTDDQGQITFKDTALPYMRALAYFGAPAVLNAVLNADNERIRNLPAWQQHSFYNIDTAPFYDEKDRASAPILRIPKTQEFGAILGNGIEAAINYIHDKDPEHFKTYVNENLGDLFTTRFLVPTAVTPALEAWANKALFFNTPIVPYGREGLLPAEQYSDRTTKAFKAASNALASIFGDEYTFRPAIAENYVDKWSGSLGRDLINGIDKAWGILSGEPILGDLKASETYYLKSFTADYPTMSAKPIRQFFENYKSADQIHKTVQKLVKEGKPEEAQKLYNKYKTVRDTKTYKAVTRMMQFMQAVKKSDLEPSRKRELIDQTMLQLIQVADQANAIMKM